MKVALVYDRVNKFGGAERVLLALHTIFPDAPLFTSVYNPRKAIWAKDFTIKTSFLQRIIFSTHHEFFAFLMPFAFEEFSFDNYDLVISVTSEAAKGIITKPSTKHVCLCLTPTRYLWSGYRQYFKNSIFKILAKPFLWYLRSWDAFAAQRPDAYIAISQEVQRRIKKYYSRGSEVIYPPVTINSEFRMQNAELTGHYFLVVSRLSRFTQYKRIDLAINVANKLKLPLKIVGEGDISFFKKKAGKTVEFLGKISDLQLKKMYEGCKALIFPGSEDFGLVMVEANACGRPVIAYKAGGALEIIKEGKTGMFFTEQSVESLVAALEKFNEYDYNSEDCIKNADRFSFNAFEKSIKDFVTL